MKQYWEARNGKFIYDPVREVFFKKNGRDPNYVRYQQEITDNEAELIPWPETKGEDKIYEVLTTNHSIRNIIFALIADAAGDGEYLAKLVSDYNDLKGSYMPLRVPGRP